jgi:hypothetical protein
MSPFHGSPTHNITELVVAMKSGSRSHTAVYAGLISMSTWLVRSLCLPKAPEIRILVQNSQ